MTVVTLKHKVREIPTSSPFLGRLDFLGKLSENYYGSTLQAAMNRLGIASKELEEDNEHDIELYEPLDSGCTEDICKEVLTNLLDVLDD